MTYIDCSLCSGTGIDDLDDWKCARCNGTGLVPDDDYEDGCDYQCDDEDADCDGMTEGA